VSNQVCAFVIPLLLGWIASWAIAGRTCGLTDRSLPLWLPAAALARLILLGRWNFSAILWTSVALLAILAGVLQEGVFGLGARLVALAILGPMGIYYLDLGRRDSRLLSRQVIFYNPISPPGTGYERVLEEGLTRDVSEPIFLYLDEEDWRSVKTASLEHRKFFDGHYRVAPNLYCASGDNIFLQAFDSLGLWPYVVHPGNKAAMSAFANALSARGTSLTQSMNPPGAPPTAPNSSESCPPLPDDPPAAEDPLAPQQLEIPAAAALPKKSGSRRRGGVPRKPPTGDRIEPFNSSSSA